MKVLSLEQMHHLKELGVDVSNASVRVGQMVFYHGDSWYGVDSYNVHLFKDDDDDTSCFEEEYKAFTLQDVIELLPKQIINCNEIYLLKIIPISNEVSYVQFNAQIWADITKYPLRVKKSDNLFNSLFEMLIWVIENGYLKTK